MLPAELVDVRRVPGLDATVRSLAAEGVVVLLSAMAGGCSCLCIDALPVAEAKLHRAWSYSTIPTCERRSIEFRPPGAVALAARASPGVIWSQSLVRADSLREILVRRQPASAGEGVAMSGPCSAMARLLYAARAQHLLAGLRGCARTEQQASKYASVYYLYRYRSILSDLPRLIDSRFASSLPPRLF